MTLLFFISTNLSPSQGTFDPSAFQKLLPQVSKIGLQLSVAGEAVHHSCYKLTFKSTRNRIATKRLMWTTSEITSRNRNPTSHCLTSSTVRFCVPDLLAEESVHVLEILVAHWYVISTEDNQLRARVN